MKPNTLFQVRFRPSVKPPRGWTHSAIYNVIYYNKNHNKYLIGKTWMDAKDFIKIEVQDAPVFDKPVLRTIKSLKENECIEIPNDTIRDLVLEQAEREGLEWRNGEEKPFEQQYPTPHFLYYRPSVNHLTYWPLYPMESDTILPASKFIEVPQETPEAEPAPEVDWSKKPFPEGYKIPVGTICKTLVEDNWGKFIIPEGSAVKVLGISMRPNTSPFVEVVSGKHRSIFDSLENGYTDGCLNAHDLAPLNPTDHPEHPDFGKKKEEPITEAQKEQCTQADERIKELERICELRLKDNDELADECEKWKTMLTATNQHIDKLRDICQIAAGTGSKEIMQAVLKSIAHGEI